VNTVIQHLPVWMCARADTGMHRTVAMTLMGEARQRVGSGRDDSHASEEAIANPPQQTPNKLLLSGEAVDTRPRVLEFGLEQTRGDRVLATTTSVGASSSGATARRGCVCETEQCRDFTAKCSPNETGCLFATSTPANRPDWAVSSSSAHRGARLRTLSREIQGPGVRCGRASAGTARPRSLRRHVGSVCAGSPLLCTRVLATVPHRRPDDDSGTTGLRASLASLRAELLAVLSASPVANQPA
jgi:hypothetical protein